MCDKADDAFLPTLNFVPPDWLVISKILENLNVVFSNDDINLNGIDERVCDIVTFLMMWVLVLQILITLNLIMIILMKMILKLLFILDS